MFRFMSTLFFIMLGFLAGRLTANEFVDAQEKTTTSILLEQAYVLTKYPNEDLEQNHKNMLLAAALLKKVSASQPAAVQEPVQEPEIVDFIEDLIYLPQDVF